MHFLRNHDELDLGRLTEAQRAEGLRRVRARQAMQLYDRGIRRRLAPMLGNDRRRLELANSLLFTLPGTPMLGYGDEIGMGDDLSLPERECARTAMQWSADPHGGFTARPRSRVAVIDDPWYGFEQVNVQRSDGIPSRSSTGWSARSACARSARRSAGVTGRS